MAKSVTVPIIVTRDDANFAPGGAHTWSVLTNWGWEHVVTKTVTVFPTTAIPILGGPGRNVLDKSSDLELVATLVQFL